MLSSCVVNCHCLQLAVQVVWIVQGLNASDVEIDFTDTEETQR